MANEIMFPIKEIPTFKKVVELIIDNFKKLSVDTRMFSIGILNNNDLDLSHGFVIVQDHTNEYVCWINFSYFELEVREVLDTNFPIMSGVIYRGKKNHKFSAIVTYILANSLKARIIYDDAYLVQKKDAYPVDELESFVEQYIKDLYPISEQ